MVENKRKYGKDLKIGDICYAISDDGGISKEEITNIQNGDNSKLILEFHTRVKGLTYLHDETSTYGMYSCIVCFSKEKVKELLGKQIEYIKKNIEKLEVI